MKRLIQYILEAKNLRKVVIYGGKFQPFHKGHYEIYEKLVKEFGEENVFGIEDNEIKEILWKMQVSSDTEELNRQTTDFVEIFNRKNPFIGICFKKEILLYKDSVKGKIKPITGNIYNGL